MKNKSAIIWLTVIIALLCVYYLSFTFVARNIQNKATAFATDAKGNVDFKKRQKYLDSLWNEPVYNFLGITSFTYKEVKEKELALGLDLQGGMHVMLEVSPVEIIKALAGNSPDANFNKALAQAREMQKNSSQPFTRLFLKAYEEITKGGKLAPIFTNTANRGKVSLNSTNAEIMKMIESEVAGAFDRSFNIIRTRVDKFGVANANVQKVPNTNRILVELPGADNPERVRKLLSGSAKLEFLEVWEMNELGSSLDQFSKYLNKIDQQEKGKEQKKDDKKQDAGSELIAKTDTQDEAKKDTTQKTEENTDLVAKTDEGKKDTTKKEAKDKDTAKKVAEKKETKKDTAKKETQSPLFNRLFSYSPEGLAVAIKDTSRVNELLSRAEVRTMFPSNCRFLWSVKPDEQGKMTLFAVKKGINGKALLEGDVITDARRDFDDNGRPEVLMQMNGVGARKWRKITADNINRRIAIVLDDNVYSAPYVRSEIPNGSSSISGNFTIEEADDLANVLKAGKLPAPTRIVEEAIVGPSLGKEAISQGLISSLIGVLIVFSFMFFYYTKGGGIANLALLVNIFFTIGILAQFGASLTLSGIAGFVLSVAMSVDANVLIYERLKEELSLGKSMKEAINLGYEKALSAIIDSNATTFLTGLILYLLGTGGLVKGFAVTLMIGIVVSVFCAVFLSRVIIEFIARNPDKQPISFAPLLQNVKFKKTNFDFVGMRKKAYLISLVIIVLGFVTIFIQGGLTLGVDFKGGRSYIVKFEQAIPVNEVRRQIVEAFAKNNVKTGTEVKTYGANNQVKITTSYLIEDESEEAGKKVEQIVFAGLEKYKNLNPEVISSSKVGASIADDIRATAQWAVVLSLVMLFAYIYVRFRSWKYGVGAAVSLFHNVLITLALTGVASLLGLNLEIDQVYIAALLTVVGYSINDTVVVFDRIREFSPDIEKADFAKQLNSAINDTLSRTIVTGTTTILVVIVLLFFAGETLRGFSFSLLVGIIFGTYSSIFVAAPLILDLKRNTPTTPATDKKLATNTA
ncbi:MAG: protein translocase subunit SecDF [Microscillaceae bacterium]|nr:protein translocase subunit SecDF [Microscillaceae bacterium]MDW8461326.1 protein translocase subunit SecDF [Cytophagales bacterium]